MGRCEETAGADAEPWLLVLRLDAQSTLYVPESIDGKD